MTANTNNHAETPKRPQTVCCPTCGKPVTYTGSSKGTAFPFCNERCQALDLGKWFDGEYVLSRDLDIDDLDNLSAEQREHLFGGESDTDV